MVAVWAAFLLTGLALLALAVLGLRWRGERAEVLQHAGQHLLWLALVTALFPVGSWVLSPSAWAGAYVAVVVVLTSLMSWSAVRRGRRVGS